MEFVIACFDSLHKAEEVRLSFLAKGDETFENAVFAIRKPNGQSRWLFWAHPTTEPNAATLAEWIVNVVLNNQKINSFKHAAEGVANKLLAVERGITFEETSSLGISDQFLQKLGNRLLPGCSALCFVFVNDGADALSESLCTESTEILRTKITYDRQRLMELRSQRNSELVHLLFADLRTKLLKPLPEAENQKISLETSWRDEYATDLHQELPVQEQRLELLIVCFETMHKAEEFRLAHVGLEYGKFEDAVVATRTRMGKLKWMTWMRPRNENYPSEERPMSLKLAAMILENPEINFEYLVENDNQEMTPDVCMCRDIAADEAFLIGISHQFLQTLAKGLQRNCSALIFALEPAAADAVAELLRSTNAQILRTSIVYDSERLAAVSKAHREVFIGKIKGDYLI